MTVAGIRKRTDKVLQKGRKPLETSASLREKKVELEEKLLSRLLELQKSLEEVYDLQEKVTSAQSEISSLREQIDKGCSEKLALEHKACVLQGNLKSRDKDVEELRAEISRQSDRYNNLWLVHGTLLEEVQTLRSEIIALRSGLQVESIGGWLKGENRNPEGPSF